MGGEKVLDNFKIPVSTPSLNARWQTHVQAQLSAFRDPLRAEGCYSAASLLGEGSSQPCSDKSIFMIMATRKAINYCKLCRVNSFGEEDGYP